jgi:hypothetical protein
MADAAPEPIKFPVTVTVDKVRVEIVLLLRPGTTATVESTKTTTAPEPPR